MEVGTIHECNGKVGEGPVFVPQYLASNTALLLASSLTQIALKLKSTFIYNSNSLTNIFDLKACRQSNILLSRHTTHDGTLGCLIYQRF